MKRNYSLYIIFVPIVFVLISILLVTAYNIKEIRESGNKQISKFTNDYLISEKTKIYNRIHFFANIIKVKSNEYRLEKENYIKEKVEHQYFLNKELFKNFKNKLSKDDIKEIILSNMIHEDKKDENGFYSIIDLDTNRVLISKNNLVLNNPIENILDSNGKAIIQKDSKYDYFINIDLAKNDNSKRKRLIYLKKIEELNWLISYGVYEEDMNKEIKKKVLKNLLESDVENNPYLFIIEIFNLNGGDNYGKVLLHQARPDLKGQLLNEKDKNKELERYRHEYLKMIRDKAEGFITYSFTKADSNKYYKKMSFFYYDKGLKWVLGTGFYFDDLDKSVKEFKKEISVQTKDSVNAAIFLASFLITIISIILYIISSKINTLIHKYSSDLNLINEKLRKQKNIFETLFKKSFDGILIYDKDGFILNCNDSIVRMLGYEEKASLLNKKYISFSPKNQFNKLDSLSKSIELNSICFEKNVHTFEWYFLKKDNRIIQCEVRATKIEIDGQFVIHSIVRDITDKKILENKAKKQQLMLAEESKKSAMGEMLTMIAHQWRQPLNNISLLIHFIRDNFDSENFSKTELKEITVDMKNQIEYLSKTINDFTNFTNPKKEVLEFPLEEAIDKTLNIIKTQFDKNNIKIIKNIDDITVRVVENEFMQVLLNILNNARDSLLKNIGKKYIFIDAKIINDRLILTIKDNAGGIPKKVLPRIFEPYFTTKHKSNGTGIGLYMSEEIIKQFPNGSLIASNENFEYKGSYYEGAMFTISFDVDLLKIYK